jgi:hypothetical protein
MVALVSVTCGATGQATSGTIRAAAKDCAVPSVALAAMLTSSMSGSRNAQRLNVRTS